MHTTQMTNYRLLTNPDQPHNGRVYYVVNNVRKWIPSGEHIKIYGFKWQEVVQASVEYLGDYSLSAPLARPCINYDENLSIWDMHELVGSQLTGKGVEFGAAANPFPCSIDCEVEYADLFDHEKEDSPYFGHGFYTSEFVKCKYHTNMEEMKGIEDGSLDFLIACHVIEHLRNPLLALETGWKKLKPGGKFVLLVPHRDLTFDKARDLTTLEHFILDYEQPLRERDFAHFLEFYEKAFVNPDPHQKALQEFNSQFSDIHYHTWNEATFLEMVNYFSKNIKPWSNITCYNHLKHPDANEFYFVLQK